MRYLDYWVGIPLCFVLTTLNHVSKIIKFNRREKPIIKKIAFIKLAELGAIVLAYPLLRSIKKEFPSAELFFVTFKKNKDIFLLFEGIIPKESVLVVRDDSFRSFVSDTLSLVRKLRKEEINIVFDLDFFSRFTAILAYLIKAGKRIGFYRFTFEGLYRGNLLTHKIQYNPLGHVSKNYLSLCQVIKKENKNTPELEEGLDENEIVFPKYLSQKENREKLQNKLKNAVGVSAKRIFLINPGEGVLPLREWPLENFITVAKWILEDAGNYIIIVGTEGGTGKVESLLRKISNPRCINFIGKTSLIELMELFCVSDVLLSNDCGLAHLAMLTSIKKFIIFGPESPQIFGPLGENNWIIYSGWPCSPCLSAINHRESACKNNLCLSVIGPKYVYDLVKKNSEIKK
jgi:ADP-heptose:LPS heptosyltransferase